MGDLNRIAFITGKKNAKLPGGTCCFVQGGAKV